MAGASTKKKIERIEDSLTNPERRFPRWAQLLAAVATVLALVFGVYVYVVSREEGSGGAAPDVQRATPTTTSAMASTTAQPTFAARVAAAQQLVDGLHTGLPEEALVQLLGIADRRHAAPQNPYGITHSLVYERDLVILQFLVDDSASVAYYTVTTTDSGATVASPSSLNENVTLNLTRVEEIGGTGNFVGFVGASFLNWGFVSGGSHADNWQMLVAGVNILGSKQRFDVADVYDAHSAMALFDALACCEPDGPYLDALAPRTCADALSGAVLSSVDVEPAPLDPADPWIVKACAQSPFLNPDGEAALKDNEHWLEFTREGTFDTFAVTRPGLFDIYPAPVFFSLWDVGPFQEDLV